MSSAPRPIRLDLAEGRVAALDFGDPERPIDVLFLHATGFNARTYTDGLSRAAGRIRIVAVDQRGHGLTELPADPAAARSWTPFADDLIAVREALGIRHPVVLSGHSMGGTVSVLAGSKLGEGVKALVLFDPVMFHVPRGEALMDSPLAQGAARRRGMFESKAAALAAYTGRGAFKTWPAQTLADYVEDGFRPSPDGGVELTCAPAWESVVFGRQDHDVWAALDRTRAPLRILRAEHGTTCHVKPESDIDGHPNRRLETVAGTSHFLPMERPDLVAEALVAASL
jgi:pimeloyl-ACP methyl ester carboxylesterase